MTYIPDPAIVRELAAEIVISHATDIEFMSVGEMIDGDQRIGDIDEDDFDTLQTAIHDMARKATVAVTFPDDPGGVPERSPLTVGEAIIALIPGAEGAGVKP